MSTDDETAQTRDAVATVATLLAAAGLQVPDNEVERLAHLYPGLRRSMDRMYDVPTGDEVPAALFRAGEDGSR
ncbi:MAG: hypothetical protein R2761_12980 [Acidimicrobiales bacterium]